MISFIYPKLNSVLLNVDCDEWENMGRELGTPFREMNLALSQVWHISTHTNNQLW